MTDVPTATMTLGAGPPLPADERVGNDERPGRIRAAGVSIAFCMAMRPLFVCLAIPFLLLALIAPPRRLSRAHCSSAAPFR